jgi:hypothetical protein
MALKQLPDLPAEEGERTDLDPDHPEIQIPPAIDWIGPKAHEQFALVIKAIEDKRPISKPERDWIADQLIGAAGIYHLRTQAAEATLQPAELAERFAQISATVSRLRRLLGAEGPPKAGELPRPSSPLTLMLAAMQAVAVEKRGSTMDALARAQTLLLVLGDLGEGATRLVQEAEKRQRESTDKPKRGGRRKDGPGALGDLMEAVFDIYAGVRERCPESGPGLVYSPGGALDRFVRACLAMIAPERPVTDASIKHCFYDWYKRRFPGPA